MKRSREQTGTAAKICCCSNDRASLATNDPPLRAAHRLFDACQRARLSEINIPTEESEHRGDRSG